MHAIKNRTSICLRLVLGVGLGITLVAPGIAQQATDEGAKPTWPDNDIAQRKFPGGYNMFVENDHGTWHAWVLDGDGADAHALDFFSGKIIPVKAGVYDNMQQAQEFTDPEGEFHNGQDRGFMFTLTGPGGLPGGIAFSGGSFSLDGPTYKCSTTLGGVKGGLDAQDWREAHPKWIKVPIYHEAATRGSPDCPNGLFRSYFNSALDLGDGTFLATTRCWVFRLNKSNLFPVGVAPALHVLDAETVVAAIGQAKAKIIIDSTDYLAGALGLSMDPEVSCKE